MFQTLSKKLRKKQGFTLIELIVVLAILGIILAIAVPNYLGVQAEASENADERAAELTEKATELWFTMENVGGDFIIVISEGSGYVFTDTAGTAIVLSPTTSPSTEQAAELASYLDTNMQFSVTAHTLLYVEVSENTDAPPTLVASFTDPNA